MGEGVWVGGVAGEKKTETLLVVPLLKGFYTLCVGVSVCVCVVVVC